MTFLLDHDVPDELGPLLSQLGHEVIRLREVLAARSPDLAVLQRARERQAVLITRCDRDDDF